MIDDEPFLGSRTERESQLLEDLQTQRDDKEGEGEEMHKGHCRKTLDCDLSFEKGFIQHVEIFD